MDDEIDRIREIPTELTGLFDRAKADELSPEEFIAELERFGIRGFRGMIYLGRAYGWPLEKVKEIYITEQYGSSEKWAKDLADAINALPSGNSVEIDDFDGNSPASSG